MLHITNGDFAADLIKSACATKDVIAWQDILYEGPVKNLPLQELSQLRAEYLSSASYGDLESIKKSFQERDEKLLSYSDHDEVVLWFEHDTYDQLQLMQILNWFSSQKNIGVELSLININQFPGVTPFLGLGQLNVKQITTLFPNRKPISDAQLQMATKIWSAFTSSDPLRLTNLFKENLSELPYIKNALLRYLREFPSTANGLTWTEQYILQSIDSGKRNFSEIFQQLPIEEREYFLGMGDATFKTIIDNLTTAATPLIQYNKSSEKNSKCLTLTALGHSILNNNKDWIILNGIDKWRGGIHLTTHSCYRLDEADKHHPKLMLLNTEQSPSDETLTTIRNGVIEFNKTVIGEKASQYAVTLKTSADEIIGGATVYTHTESIYIDILWVADKFRNKGYGSLLIKMVEEEGRAKGCKYSTLDTFAFQAEKFYENHGYKRIGVIPKYLFEHDRIFLRKEL